MKSAKYIFGYINKESPNLMTKKVLRVFMSQQVVKAILFVDCCNS